MDQGKLIFLKSYPNSPSSFDVVKMAGKKKPLNTETLEILIFHDFPGKTQHLQKCRTWILIH